MTRRKGTAVDSSEVQRRIRAFMERDLLVEFDGTVTPQTDLFSAGVIESRDYLSIIRFLRDDLGIPVTDEDLFSNVLVSLDGIDAFVRGKLAAR
jgi:hypothetical protein